MAVRILVLALAIGAAGASPAHANDIHVALAVRPGPLRLSSAQVVASGHETRIRAMVVDARGNGAGWVLELSPGRPATAARLLSIVVACGPRSTCRLPDELDRVPTTLAGARTTPIVTAHPGSGMGRIDLTITIAGFRPGVAAILRVRPL